ncbi:MAG: hypothetical protein ABWZ76_05105 [Acidimicrobiales bacterium]
MARTDPSSVVGGEENVVDLNVHEQITPTALHEVTADAVHEALPVHARDAHR